MKRIGFFRVQYFTAKVYGLAWAGYKANTEYTFRQSTPPTRDQIKARGDFASITRIILTHVVERTTITRAKVKG